MQLSFYMLHMVPLSHSHLLFMDAFLFHVLPQCSLAPSITQPKPSLYICLSPSATNTAWSMRHVFTYLIDDTPCILANFNLLDLPL